MTGAVGVQTALAPLSEAELKGIVRRHLKLSPNETVSLEEISRHTNLNHIYKVLLAGSALYLKIVPERPKRLPVNLPRERVVAEAEALRIFKQHASGEVLVPDVLFVDREDFAFGMTDVGEGREVLLDILHTNYALLVPQAAALGRALGSVHRGTTGLGEFRPQQHDQLLRRVVFQGLLAPGSKAVFPDLADRVLDEMNVRRQCLVHADLWGKNILVGQGVVPAIVDFEGAFVGDAAFDVATVLATALLPAIECAALLSDCAAFTLQFLSSYRRAYRNHDVAEDTSRRAYYYSGTLLAARGFGPFAYPLSGETQKRLGVLARNLTAFPPVSPAEYVARIVRCHDANEQ